METPAEYTAPQAPKSAILALLEDRPIAYHPLLAKVLGGVKQAVFVSQLLYWTGKGKRADGFIWKKQEEWTEETGLSANEQRTARKHLVKSGVLQEKLKGIPAQLYYRIDTDALQARLAEYHDQVIHNVEILPSTTSTAIPEITPEITTEEGEGATAPHAPAGDWTAEDTREWNRDLAFDDPSRLPDNDWPPAPPDSSASWPVDTTRLPDSPPPNPAQARIERMRSVFGGDPLTVAAHCAERQAAEGTWTVPEHQGLSPACAVFKDATGYAPPRGEWRDRIDEHVGDGLGDLERWHIVCVEYVGCGWSPRNVKGMLDFYVLGQIPTTKPEGKGNGGASGGRNGTGGIDPEKLRIYNERMAGRLVGATAQ